MSKKILFLLLFAFSANVGYGQKHLIVNPLPGGSITTNGVEYLHCRINSLTSAPATPCDIVVAISEQAAITYGTGGAMIRWKNDLGILNLDARDGAAYVANLDLLPIQYDIDYYVYFLLDIPSGKYSLYARTENMTELYKLLDNAAYRNIPVSSLEYSSILYYKDTTTVPVLRVKEFKAMSPLKFATGINIGNLPVIGLNVPAKLTATTLPADANTGIVWKVLKGDSYATITSDGMITVKKDTTIDVEAYAVTSKGAAVVKASAKLNISTGVASNFGNFEAIKLSPTISPDGNFNIQIPENLNQNLNYKVYSVFGQEIKSGLVGGNKLNIGTDKSGVYIVRFRNSAINQSVEVLIK